MNMDFAFPTKGIVTERDGLTFAWPEPSEFDALTSLRNREGVRKWFLDPSLLDVEGNRTWLSSGMRRGEEGLLAIRLTETGDLLGTIGWSDHSAVLRTACFGRLMIDARKAAELRGKGKWHGGSIGYAAALTLRDFSFAIWGLESLTTWYFLANRNAAKVNAAIGMRICGEGMRTGRDGVPIATVELELTRREWQAMATPT